MPKALLYGLASLGVFAVAVFAFLNDSIVVPLVLVVAGFCFIMAAIGAAKQGRRAE